MATRHFGPTVSTLIPGTAGDDARVAALNKLLEPADVIVNGHRPQDLCIHDSRALDQILRRGSLGAGEAYMRGWWDVPALDDLVCRLLRADIDRQLRTWSTWPNLLRAWLTNPQRPSRAFRIGEAHYDGGNDLFAAMLDRRMVYSCGYWQDAASLDEAQTAKLELVCRKLGLKPGQRLLDIGCGWGSLCEYAALHYGVEAVGVTVSEEQQSRAMKRFAALPIEIRLTDYRDLDEPFDHIASIGMVEHVGARNYRQLMQVAHRCLRPGGLFLLHSIGSNVSRHSVDPWIDRYIFPDGQLPSLPQLSRAAEGLFVIEDLHNFGSNYDRTLRAWFENFDRTWPKLRARYDETFYRMWKYYLLTCAGAFRARSMQLWQIVLSHGGVPGGYRRPEM